MKNFSMLLFLTLLTACPGPTLEPGYTPTWYQMKATQNYEPEVGQWSKYQCEDPRSYEEIDSDHSVVFGLHGYTSPCLLRSPTVESSSWESGRQFRVTVLQKGGPSTTWDIPYYTHLFIQFDDIELNENQLQYMPFAFGQDYEAIYTFDVPPAARTLNLVLGVDPAYMGSYGIQESQPWVQLKTVKLEVLK